MAENDVTRKNWNEWGWKVFVGLIVGVIVALIVWQAVVCSSCTYGGGCWFRNCSDSSGGGGGGDSSGGDPSGGDTSGGDPSGCYVGNDDPSRCPSAAIAGIDGNVCFAPFEHILGSPTLESALQDDITNRWGGLDDISKTRRIMYALGSSGVKNNPTGWSDGNGGKCFQIQIEPYSDGGTLSPPVTTPVDLILMSINTGLSNSFDTFLPQGGEGAFGGGNFGACDIMWGAGDTSDDGSPFWVGHIQDSDLCIDLRDSSEVNETSIRNACADYFGFVSWAGPNKDDAKSSLVESCVASVASGVACGYQNQGVSNHVGVWREVQCPPGLERVSGMQRTDGSGLPYPGDSSAPFLPTDVYAGSESECNCSQYGGGDHCSWDNNEQKCYIKDTMGITQMMDCRSPNSSQNYHTCQESDDCTPFLDSLAPGRTAAYNVDVDGSLITTQGWHGCMNTMGDANWSNAMPYSNASQYTVGNCPLAFPPGADQCTRYKNSSVCGNMVQSSCSSGAQVCQNASASTASYQASALARQRAQRRRQPTKSSASGDFPDDASYCCAYQGAGACAEFDKNCDSKQACEERCNGTWCPSYDVDACFASGSGDTPDVPDASYCCRYDAYDGCVDDINTQEQCEAQNGFWCSRDLSNTSCFPDCSGISDCTTATSTECNHCPQCEVVCTEYSTDCFGGTGSQWNETFVANDESCWTADNGCNESDGCQVVKKTSDYVADDNGFTKTLNECTVENDKNYML